MTTFQLILSLFVSLAGVASAISQAILHTKLSATQTTLQNVQAAASIATATAPAVATLLQTGAPLLPTAAQPTANDIAASILALTQNPAVTNVLSALQTPTASSVTSAVGTVATDLAAKL